MLLCLENLLKRINKLFLRLLIIFHLGYALRVIRYSLKGGIQMKDRQGFGSRIKEMREHRNLTIEQAAELCDCSESTWKQYERGERLPSVPKLKSICLVLKVKPEYIYGSELDGLQEDITEIGQLKLKIEQLPSDDIAIIKAAVEKRLELLNG